MLPTDYRLENVAARLTERLDGMRRSYDDPEAARAAFARAAEEHVEAAIEELRGLGTVEEPVGHAEFLRREIHETYLPRFHREAMAMNVDEARGHGLGRLATPEGRVIALVVALAAFWEMRFIPLGQVRLLFPLLLTLPIWPDVAGWFAHRRYSAALNGILDDLARIQEQATPYAPAESLRRVDDDLRARPPRPRRETER